MKKATTRKNFTSIMITSMMMMAVFAPPVERLEVGEHLERGEQTEGDGHLDIEPVGGVGVTAAGAACSSPSEWAVSGDSGVTVAMADPTAGKRYTIVKITIQTMSTKCQYRPMISTVSARSWGRLPRIDITNSDISMMMPMVT